MESVIFNEELGRQPEGLPVQGAGRAFSELANKTRPLDLLNRYDSRFERQYHRALNQLRRERDQLLTQNFQTNPDSLNPSTLRQEYGPIL